MLAPQLETIGRTAGLVLLLGVIATFPGLMMFWVRGGQRGGAPRSRAHYVTERASIMAGAGLTAIGFVLLADYLQTTAGRSLAIGGAAAYFFGSVLIVAAEALNLTLGYEQIYGLVVSFVVSACLAQIAIGGALLQAGSIAAWIGWVTILWNAAGLIGLSLFSRRDMYFPVLHQVAPLVIGLALLGLGA
jgi:hypothetical protein